MKNKLSLFLIFALFWFSHSIRSQSRQIDSLLNCYKKASQDSTCCRLMLEIGDQFENKSPDTALLWYYRAYTLANKTVGNSGYLNSYLAIALQKIAWIEGQYKRNYQKSLDYSNQSLKLFEILMKILHDPKALKQAKEGYSRCFTNIGSVNKDQGNYDKAIEYYSKSLKINEEMKDKKGMANNLNNIGIVYYNKGNYDKTIEYYSKSLELFMDLENAKGMAASYNNLGNVYFNQGSFDKALENYLKSLKIYEKAGNKNGIAVCYNNLGNVYDEQDNVTKAIEYYLKSLNVYEEIGDKKRIAARYNNLGIAEKKRKNENKALEYYLKSVKILEETGDKKELAAIYNNIGKTLQSLGNYEQALEYFQKSLQIKTEIGEKKGICVLYASLSNLYLSLADSSVKTGSSNRNANLEKAISNGEKAYQLALEIGTVQIQNETADYLKLANMKMGRYTEACKYAGIFIATKDSMYNLEKTQSLVHAEKQFEGEKKQLQIEKLENENKLQKKLNYLFFIGFLIILIFSGLLLLLFQQKKKANSLIAQKNINLELAFNEIRSQKEEIERISGELHALDEIKLKFFTNLSHELRTPLTLILNPAKQLLDKKLYNEEQKKRIEYIYTNAVKLHDLTNQIMELQKLDAGKLILRTEKTDIIDHCLSTISSFESLCENKNNTIKFTAFQHSVIAELDKDKVEKILVNLLSNAIKFCYDNSTIEMQLGVENNVLNIVVIDKGIGIPQTEIDRVFKRYYQVHSDIQSGGTGIGLAYVKELTEFMKGEVSMNSVINEGTKIEIHIPVDNCEILNSNILEVEIPDKKSQFLKKQINLSFYNEYDENENSILIIEDNPELRNYITDLFSSEYVVYSASDGEEGLNLALEYIPNLIISDVMMPKKDGFELCRILKSDERTSHIPIVLLTARDSYESNLQGYQLGADDYIIKPFDSDLLNLKVKNILSTYHSMVKQFNLENNTLPETPSLMEIDRNFLQKCIKLIEQNIENMDFSVEQMATALNFSRSNLYRKIQSLTNLSPAELMRNIRMNYAYKLLESKCLRVNEVAMKVGYTNSVKFSQAFKKYHGILPSEIINNLG